MCMKMLLPGSKEETKRMQMSSWGLLQSLICVFFLIMFSLKLHINLMLYIHTMVFEPYLDSHLFSEALFARKNYLGKEICLMDFRVEY